jgi:hypothetical protein
MSTITAAGSAVAQGATGRGETLRSDGWAWIGQDVMPGRTGGRQTPASLRVNNLRALAGPVRHRHASGRVAGG